MKYNNPARLLLALLRRSLQVLTICTLLGMTGLAQSSSNTDGTTPLSLTPGAPAGAYPLSGLENINLFNGNLNFSLPLLSVGGRGEAKFQMTLPIEQHWRVESFYSQNAGYNIYYPNYNWWTGLKVGYGPGVLHGRTTVLATSDHCVPDRSWITAARIVTRLTFTGPDGTELELRDQLTGGRPLDNSACVAQGPTRGTVFTSADGSAATFVSDTTIFDNVLTGTEPNPIFYPTGYLMLRNGLRYRIQNGLVTWIRDRNGNKVTFAYDNYAPNLVPANRVISITDSLNRQITISYDVQEGLPYGLCDKIQFRGFGGAIRIIRVSRAPLGNVLRANFSLKTYQQLFPEFNGSCSTCTHNPTVTSAVWLPDGRSYGFFYNSYGELARVKLPTGGSYEYDYGPGLTNGVASGAIDDHSLYRRVIEKRSYKDDTDLASRSTFSRPESLGPPPNYFIQTTGFVDLDSLDLTGNLLSRSRHYFYGAASDQTDGLDEGYPKWQSGLEYKTETIDANGTTVLLRSTKTWQQRAPVSWWNSWCTPVFYCAAHPELEPANDRRIAESQTELTETSPIQVSKQMFGYDDSVPFNNQNNIKEYNYGPNAPGALLRETRTTYLTASNYTGTAVHTRSLPTLVSIRDSGGVERARTTYEYDNYAIDPNHAPLVNRSSISGLDAAFNTSFTLRGNATATTRYLLNTIGSVIGSVTEYAQCDIAGNIVKTIDGRGFAVTFDFSDRFGGPDADARANAGSIELNSAGQVSYGYVTKRTKAGLNVYTQFDYYLGRPVDVEDENETTYSGSYDDALDRPRQMISASNRGVTVRNQTSFIYDDVSRRVTTVRDQDTYNDNLLKSETIYDGLGRVTETQQYEGGTNYIAVRMHYDALGRVFETSNPLRPWLEDNPVWTKTVFDALGRVLTTTTADNAVVATAYNGNQILVKDQAGKQRMSRTNALGQLTDVWEITAADDATEPITFPGRPEVVAGYRTRYEYDTVGNLAKVIQQKSTTGTTQTRTFTYDTLSRLSSAINPETGTINYEYDANGNLTSKTDARQITTTYLFDALNRNTDVDYSDTVINPDIKRVYDNPMVGAYGKGRFWESFAGGDLTVGTSVEHTKIASYDALGRPLDQRQRFKFDGNWKEYQIQRTYDLAGHVKTQTYPSSHKVSYNYDAAGRLADKDVQNVAFRGDLGDGVPRTYASGISYSEFGGLKQEQLGTQTAVFHKLHYNVRGQLYDIRLSTMSLQSNEWDWNRGRLSLYYGYPHQQSGPLNNGNVSMMQHFVPANEATTLYNFTEQRYVYDQLNRLSSVAEYPATQAGYGANSLTQVFDYDRWGNRTINSATTNAPEPQFIASGATNRLGVPVGQTGRMDYDAAGNLVNDTYTSFGRTDGTPTRQYDAENRLSTAKDGNLQVVSSYSYNADGQRMRRKVGSVETWQVYGMGGELLAEYAANGAVTQPQKEYGYRGAELLVTAAAGAASISTQNVSWTSAVGVSINGNSLQRISGGFFGGAISSQAIASGDGYVEFTATETNKNRWCGLANGNSNVFTSDIEFGIYLVGGGTIQIQEGSTFIGNFGTYTSGDRFRISVESGVVKYSKNGGVLHTSVTTPNYPLLVDSSLSEVGGTITNAVISGNLSGGSGGGSEIYWLIADHLGTPRMIVDKSGALANIKRNDYLPFGEKLGLVSGRTTGMGYAAADTPTDAVRQKFTSKERDTETLLDYFGARYYSSGQGRFTTPDPLLGSGKPSRPQTWNRYTYVVNNPLRMIDPNGLDGEDTDEQRKKAANAQRIIYVFVGAKNRSTPFTPSPASAGRGFKSTAIPPDNFADLAKSAPKGTTVTIINEGDARYSPQGFTDALQDKNAAAVIFAGDTKGQEDAEGVYHATGLDFGANGSLPADKAIDVNAQNVAIFGCDSQNIQSMFNFTGSKQSLMGMNSGGDGYSSPGWMGRAAFAASGYFEGGGGNPDVAVRQANDRFHGFNSTAPFGPKNVPISVKVDNVEPKDVGDSVIKLR